MCIQLIPIPLYTNIVDRIPPQFMMYSYYNRYFTIKVYHPRSKEKESHMLKKNWCNTYFKSMTMRVIVERFLKLCDIRDYQFSEQIIGTMYIRPLKVKVRIDMNVGNILQHSVVWQQIHIMSRKIRPRLVNWQFHCNRK